MKHLGLHAFDVHLIHMQAPVLPAKYCEMPCKGFLLSNVTSAHNALRPRAPLSATFLLHISSALLAFIALQALTRRDDQIPGVCQKGKVLPSSRHQAVQE